MRRFVFGWMVLGVLGSVPESEAAGPVWTQDLPPEIAWYQLTDAGVLLVATPKALLGLSPKDGATLWQRDDLVKVQEQGITFLPGTPTAMVLEAEWKIGQIPNGTLHMLDVTTGKDLWTVQSGMVMYTQPHWEDTSLFTITQDYVKGKPVWTGRRVEMATGKEIWRKEHYFGTKAPVLNQWQANPDKKLSIKMTLQGNQPLQFVEGGTHYLETWHAKQGVVKRSWDTGEIVWSTPAKFVGTAPAPRNGKPPMVVAGNTVLVSDNAQKVLGYQVSDGVPIGKGVSFATPVQSVSDLGDDRVFVAGGDAKKGFVAILDPNTMSEAWKKPIKIKGALAFADAVEGNRLVVGDTDGTSTEVTVYDIPSGEDVLEAPIKLPGGVDTWDVEGTTLFASGSNGKKTYLGTWGLDTGTSHWGEDKGVRLAGSVPNLVIRDDRVLFVTTAGTFAALSRADGAPLFTTELPMQGKGESLRTLFERSDGSLVTWSSQNVLGLDPSSGNVLWKQHYPPPPITGLQAVAGVALMAAAATSAAASGATYASTSYQDAGSYTVVTTTTNTETSQNFAAMSSAFGAAAGEVMTRAKASKSAENSYFILTKLEDGVGLVRVSLDDGSELARIPLGTREPDYQIDEYDGRLFLLRDAKTLEGWSIGTERAPAP